MPSYKLELLVDGKDNASGPFGGLIGIVEGLGKATVALAAGGLAVVGAGLGASVKTAAEFDKQMSAVQAVSLATAGEMDQLSAAALRIGKDTSFGATEAGSAIEMLVANGIAVNDVLNGAADATVALAAATGADLTTAATVGSDAMNIFGIEAKDMAKAINGISGVTVASKFDINDYALALAQGGGVAKASGVSFDDFNTTIAAISPLFASGSDAGTSYKTMLSSLIPKSADAAGMMQQLGLYTGMTDKQTQAATKEYDKLNTQIQQLSPTSDGYAEKLAGLQGRMTALHDSLEQGQNQFYNADGSMKSMAEVAGLLQGAFKGLSDEQRNNALSTIFGSDASRAAAALAEVGADKFRTLAGAIGEVDAAAQAATRLDNLAGDFDALKGSLEVVGIQLGQSFTPLLRQLTQAANDFIATHLIDRDWTPIITGVQGAITGIASLAGSVQGFVTTLQNDPFGTLMGIGEQLAGRLTSALPGVQGSLEGIGNTAIQWAQTKAVEWGTALQPWAQKAGAWAVEAIPALLLGLGEMRNRAVGWALLELPKWIDALMPWVAKTGQWVIDALPGLLKNFGILTGDLLDRVGAALPGIVESLAKWGAVFVDWAIVAGPKLITELLPLAGSLMGWIAERVPGIAEQVGKWAVAFVGWLGPKLPEILNAMGGAFGDILTYIAQQGPAIQTTLVQWGQAFWNWATTDGKTALGNAIVNMASGVWDSNRDNFLNMLNPGSIGQSIVRGIGDGIYQAWGGLSNWFSSLFATLTPGQQGGIPYPTFAGGVRNFAGGMAIVGERGPELVSLPAGANVFSNGDSQRMAGGGLSASAFGGGGAGVASGGGVTINVTVQGSVLKERDLALTIREQFLDYQRNNPTLGFTP